MVLALLAGTKAQTRRIVKPQPDQDAIITVGEIGTSRGAAYIRYPREGGITTRLPCPYGQPGDRLWVRETHLPKASGTIYRADFSEFEAAGLGGMYGGWKPSIFCKREHSRITLEITAVRVERLQDISGADAMAEGIISGFFGGECEPGFSVDGLDSYDDSAVLMYKELWESINGEGSWDANPWVWIIEFKPVLSLSNGRVPQ